MNSTGRLAGPLISVFDFHGMGPVILMLGMRRAVVVRASASSILARHTPDRRRLDAELCADISKLEGMGDARITAAAKEIAARLDAQAVVDRAAKAEADRTVTIRPAPDCMTYVTAFVAGSAGGRSVCGSEALRRYDIR